MTRTKLVPLAAAAFALGLTAQAHGEAHKVKSGQTLWSISKKYGCKVADLKKANELKSQTIKVGQKLTLPESCTKSKAATSAKEIEYVVAKGDTLGAIAKQFDTTVKAIKNRNGIKKKNLIKPGQKLKIVPGKGGRGLPINGQSVGEAWSGSLQKGKQLPKGKGYHRRRPKKAWGANQTIFNIQMVVRTVRKKHPKVHDLAIGDISKKKGGQISQHRSHQSGRDVDIGFYFKKRPKGYPTAFKRGTKKNLDMDAMWTLLKAFYDTNSKEGGVQVMFLDYDVQGFIYEWAKSNGKSKKTIKRMFQYPNGKGSSGGIIRHEPGHHAHVHVRFKCPKKDKGCK